MFITDISYIFVQNLTTTTVNSMLDEAIVIKNLGYSTTVVVFKNKSSLFECKQIVDGGLVLKKPNY